MQQFCFFFLSNSIYLLPYCKKNTACLTFHKKTLKKVLSEIHWPIILLPMGFNNRVESIVQRTSGWPLQVKSERYWKGRMGTSSPYSSLISFFQEHQIHSFELIKLKFQLNTYFKVDILAFNGKVSFEIQSVFRSNIWCVQLLLFSINYLACFKLENLIHTPEIKGPIAKS